MGWRARKSMGRAVFGSVRIGTPNQIMVTRDAANHHMRQEISGGRQLASSPRACLVVGVRRGCFPFPLPSGTVLHGLKYRARIRARAPVLAGVSRFPLRDRAELPRKYRQPWGRLTKLARFPSELREGKPKRPSRSVTKVATVVARRDHGPLDGRAPLTKRDQNWRFPHHKGCSF